MRVNVAQLLKEPIGSRRFYSFSDVIEGALVQVQTDLLKTDEGVMVGAYCRTNIEGNCGRCLTGFTQLVEFSFMEEFCPMLEVDTGAQPQLGEGVPFGIDERKVLDVTEAVHQYRIMATPMKDLCRSDCQGLCSQCGTNLNQAPCSCSGRFPHPAFEELGRLWGFQNS